MNRTSEPPCPLIDQDLTLLVEPDGEVSLQEFLVYICISVITGTQSSRDIARGASELQRVGLTVLHQLLLSPLSRSLSRMHLEHSLVELLQSSLNNADPFLQVPLLDVTFAALRLNSLEQPPPLPSPSIISHRRFSSQDVSAQSKPGGNTGSSFATTSPPAALVNCLQLAFSSTSTLPVLDSWISFLSEVLPFYTESIFQILIPLIETLCAQVSKTFEKLKSTFAGANAEKDNLSPESTLIALLNGLEQVLGRAHDRLRQAEARVSSSKLPDQPQGFFGNMVSGVFTSDAPQTRSQNANNRLTVLLSFQDTVRISFLIWSWGGSSTENSALDPDSSASFNYTSLRMRNRARRLLEHLFSVEALECLETVIEIWKQNHRIDPAKAYAVFNLLHVLDGSRPKYTMPAIFDAIYSRTNPSALDPTRKSTLSAELQDTDIIVFLVEYAKSLEDDAMDEIWVDCMTFLRDILTNPFPHRQILPCLLEFAAILGEKVDNTNFGEQKKMRRDLGVSIDPGQALFFQANASRTFFFDFSLQLLPQNQ